MSLLLRTNATTFTRTLPCAARAFSSYKGVTATLKDAAKVVDHTAARAALKGLEAAERVRGAVGVGAKEAAGRAVETGGWAVGGTAEKARVGGKAANEYSEAAKGEVNELAGKAKGAYNESRS